MIKSLHIHNYALIASLELDFPGGLTIITGETGAGKSILLGALGLIMGERADTKALFDPAQKCVIEGRFHIADYQLADFFKENDLDYEDELIIRREITPAGKSRAFINDTPTNLKVLQELSNVLIDLHQQFDTLDIHNMSFQMRLLDALAGNAKRLESYQKNYKHYTDLRRQLAALQQQDSNAVQEAEFIRFQLQELIDGQLEGLDQTAMENEMEALTHAEDIKRAATLAFQGLSEHEHAVLGQLREISKSLQEAGRYDGQIRDMHQRLWSHLTELEDLSVELEKHAENAEFDPERQYELQQRLDGLYRLQKKHGCTTVGELRELEARFAQQLHQFQNRDEEIAKLQQQLDTLQQQLKTQAMELRKAREGVAPGFAAKVQQSLAELSMPSSQLVIDMQQSPDFTPVGLDEVTFLFSANKGSSPKPIKDVASGGELSRLTLVTKSLVASAMALPTLIFDEIDAGVSGDVALKMGHILHQLSQHHQVIVITHSPQVAARGEEHLFVYKKDMDERTTTKVRSLNHDERIRAIATMLSQSPPSPSALENAKELMEM